MHTVSINTCVYIYLHTDRLEERTAKQAFLRISLRQPRWQRLTNTRLDI